MTEFDPTRVWGLGPRIRKGIGSRNPRGAVHDKVSPLPPLRGSHIWDVVKKHFLRGTCLLTDAGGARQPAVRAVDHRLGRGARTPPRTHLHSLLAAGGRML